MHPRQLCDQMLGGGAGAGGEEGELETGGGVRGVKRGSWPGDVVRILSTWAWLRKVSCLTYQEEIVC